MQLVAMGTGLLVFGLIVSSGLWALAGWHKLRWRGLIVPAVSALVLVAGPAIGGRLREWNLWWDMPRYKAAAEWVEHQALSSEGSEIELPPEYADLAYGVRGIRSAECGTVVTFWWGSGFPVKHTARVYSPTGSFERSRDCRGHWSRGSLIDEHWYEATD
jgi:hypothetical protein